MELSEEKKITNYKSKNSWEGEFSTYCISQINFWNTFTYFEDNTPSSGIVMLRDLGTNHLELSRTYVCKSITNVNLHKVPGSDGIPFCGLRECADQLTNVFTDTFNLSLAQSVVPACLKTIIIPVLKKKNKAICLNDYQLVALTSHHTHITF